MYVCDRCGANWVKGMRWCVSCHAPAGSNRWRSEPGVPDPDTVATAPDPAPVGVPGPRKRPDQVERLPVERARYSRWERGATTLGPAGRILGTLLVLGLGLFLVTGGPSVFLLIGYLPLAALTLWGLWRKDNVEEGERPPAPWRASVRETSESFRRSLRDRRGAG